MFLMNRFFDGAFLTFGIEVITFMQSDQEDRIDPMIFIFPRMTKCTFYKFGSSGEIERHDAVCILPLNVVNEKIYIFLWFWFLFLGCITLCILFYRWVNNIFILQFELLLTFCWLKLEQILNRNCSKFLSRKFTLVKSFRKFQVILTCRKSNQQLWQVKIFQTLFKIIHGVLKKKCEATWRIFSLALKMKLFAVEKIRKMTRKPKKGNDFANIQRQEDCLSKKIPCKA